MQRFPFSTTANTTMQLYKRYFTAIIFYAPTEKERRKTIFTFLGTGDEYASRAQAPTLSDNTLYPLQIYMHTGSKTHAQM